MDIQCLFYFLQPHLWVVHPVLHLQPLSKLLHVVVDQLEELLKYMRCMVVLSVFGSDVFVSQLALGMLYWYWMFARFCLFLLC